MTDDIRYWQHVESGHVNMTRRGSGPDGVAERDPIWVEVTISPLVSGDVIEAAAEVAHRAVYSSLRLADLSQEEREDTYRRVRGLAAAGMLTGAAVTEDGLAERVRADLAAVGIGPSTVGGQRILSTVIEYVRSLAGPRPITPEQADALRSELAYRLRTVASHYRASGRHGTDVDPRVMDTHIDRGTERVLAVLGLTMEGDES